jgi:hypothetical protein
MYSGLWMLSDPHELDDVVSAMEILDREVPFTYEDASWLRLCLMEARGYELFDFLVHVRRSTRGTGILEDWAAWAGRCRCKPARPMKSCVPHAFVHQGRRFRAIMSNEWKRVSDWYREPGSQRYLSFPDQLA